MLQLVDRLRHLDFLLKRIGVLDCKANGFLEVFVGCHFELDVFSFFAF